MTKYTPDYLYRINEIEATWNSVNYEIKVNGTCARLDEFLCEVGNRIQYNLNTIIDALKVNDYIFCNASCSNLLHSREDIWRLPNGDSRKAVNALSEYGDIGYLVKYWMTNIGDVNINGYHRSWKGHIPCDPMWIEFQGLD